MTPDIHVAINYALAQLGKPYSTGGDRFGPDRFDCSGLVIRSLAEAGVPLPRGISVERKWGNSVSLYNWAKDSGGLVSVDQAAKTNGAILIKGRWYGNGPLGDVKFSLGDGRQTGAGSRRTGVATREMYQGFFHDGFIIPGVNYHLEPPVDPDVLAAILALIAWEDRVTAKPLKFGVRGPNVALLVDLLRARHFLKAGVRGDKYGSTLRTGIYKFKLAAKARGLLDNTDGKNFGGDAAHALLNFQ